MALSLEMYERVKRLPSAESLASLTNVIPKPFDAS